MGIRISEMEEATTFGADDYVPIVTSGTNKKALGAKIKDFIAGFFVSKSGDSMTGDLIVEKSNGEFVSKNPNVTINTSANNGVTSSQIEGVIVKDSANNNVARFLAFQETTGDVIIQLAAFNKKTDGTETNNYINATVKKDGTRTYTVADPAAFRNSIEAEPRTIYDTFNVTFSGTVTPSTPLKDTQTSVAKSGYKIISITPQLTVADSNIILTPLVFGGQDNQIITTCQISTGSRVNPTCTLQVLYRKSSY